MHYVRQDESMKSFYCSFYSFSDLVRSKYTLCIYIYCSCHYAEWVTSHANLHVKPDTKFYSKAKSNPFTQVESVFGDCESK